MYSVQSAFYSKKTAAGDMSITSGSAERGMPKEALNIMNVRTAFKQMDSKCIAKAVNRYFFVNISPPDGFI